MTEFERAKEAFLDGIEFLHDEDFPNAEKLFHEANKLMPDRVSVLTNLSAVLLKQDKIAEAKQLAERSVQLDAGNAEGWLNCGACAEENRDFLQALSLYDKAHSLKVDYAEAWVGRGKILHKLGRLAEAETSYRRALVIKPDFAEAYDGLGVLLQADRLSEAEICYRQALENKPGFIDAHSNLLFALNYSLSYDPVFCLDEARSYGCKVSKKIGVPFFSWICATRPARLRVGLVSGDLNNHPVGYFLENVLAHVDPDCLELIAYSTQRKEDTLTARLKPFFSSWRSLVGKSDEEAARLIHADSVHVLMDISGHTAYNRLPVFAWRPAPVQVSWLGYFATTGVAAMDYLIADPHTLPVGEEAYFTEKIWRLPETRLCFTPPEAHVAVSPLPALANTYVTFGCFNNLAKMNDAVVALWARVLGAVPQSRLFLKAGQLADDAVRMSVVERFSAHGVTADRLILEGGSPRAEYLAAYQKIDIALDPFPYPGGATSVEALWMGVPVLTLKGDRFLSRQGMGLLVNAGLPEWIANDFEDYVAKAEACGRDLVSLAGLRTRLRQQVLASPLFDAPRFAHQFEVAIWEMWHTKAGIVS